jgi:hypothetical protein
MRRRVTHGSWKSMASNTDRSPINFPPPLPTETAAAPAPAPTDVSGERARTLAGALEGIAMPCDLAPLMGTGPPNPCEVSFFTGDQDPAEVGRAIADELERLDYEISPVDHRSIRAERGQNLVQARIVSAATNSEEVFAELHPSAPKDSVVVELKLV